MYASFGEIEIPKIQSVSIKYNYIGDKARTAGGYLRQDTIAVKRTWTITTRALSLYSANTLIGALMNAKFAPGDFWIHGFGYTGTGEGAVKNTVRAVINPESLEEVIEPFGEDGTWHNDGRRLSFEVEEV